MRAWVAESTIGLFRTELVKRRAPWWTVEQVEIATLEWVDWFNHRCLHSTCGDIPPAELEAAHYRHHRPTRSRCTQTIVPDTPGRFNHRVRRRGSEHQ